MEIKEVANLLRGLVVDGVNAANSGHPGGAMSSMDFAALLYTKHLNFDPDDPEWPGRDRFILSAGHESMLLYSLIHAIGWLPKEELQNFRQLHSKTPGHPENYLTPGVECTTGPLGQGAAMSVGFAIGARHAAARVDGELFNNRTWALLGDGCMQEGVTFGAASMAGHLGLENLIWYYDRNNKQISGDISRVVSEDPAKIFEGFGWNVHEIDGHDYSALDQAIGAAKKGNGKPTLIIGTSIMAKGAANVEGQHNTHGAPLKQDELAATKKVLGVPDAESFYFPQNAVKAFQKGFASLRSGVTTWKNKLNSRIESDQNFKSLYESLFISKAFDHLPAIDWSGSDALATRNAFGKIIDDWADALPFLVGGSADLEPSNMTGAFAKKVGDFSRENPEGRNLAFGVREFPMSAVSNGLALYAGYIPFDATFLTFADYSRPALRLGAIQKVRAIHELTHDSFYVGEDGPTHQPIEHVMSLRLIPDMYVMRPADAKETEVMMKKAVNLSLPSSICLTRQKLPLLSNSADQIAMAEKGAWVVRECDDPEYIMFATGSEVHLAMTAADALGARVRIVSIPCWELFFEQDTAYQKEILDWKVAKRISLEAGTGMGWERFVGPHGLKVSIDHYGESAPASALEKEFGFTSSQVVEKIKSFNWDA